MSARVLAHPILQLQQTIGNQAVQRLLQSRTMQAKLAISQPGDIYEQEADRLADEVMRMPEPTLQRFCAPCAAGGAPCPTCEDEKARLVQRKAEQPSDSASVPDDFLRSLGPGQPLDSAARAYFEPRFGHDFSQVRVHDDSKAAESACSLNALAYTVGTDVIFGAGGYAPETAAGRRLLAHELVHTIQGARGVQRAPDKPVDEVAQYLEYLKKNRTIEAGAKSKEKALTVVEKGMKESDYRYSLPDDLDYLIIAELARGKTTKAHRDAIIEALERMGNPTLNDIFKPGKIEVAKLVAHYTGDELARLEDFFTRRFEGGLAQVKAGTIKAKGENVPQGIPLSSLDVIKSLVKWLGSNKKSAPDFFRDVWSKSKIVLLGEMHLDDVQRQFAADRLAAVGGKDVGLALEITITQQAEVDYYVKNGTLPKDAKGWWRNDKLYKKIIESAKNTKTQVIAMDLSGADERDKHMAGEVEKLAKSKSKILVYVGAMHIKEASADWLGKQLAAKFGGNSYVIDMFTPKKSDNIYWMIKDAFPSEKSLGFDIDASPLAKYPDPAFLKFTLGETLDGYVYFHSSDSYQ